jgi:hypothetical protein
MIKNKCDRPMVKMIKSQCDQRSCCLRHRPMGEMIESKCDRSWKSRKGKLTTDKIPLQSIEEGEILLVLPTPLQYCTLQSR